MGGLQLCLYSCAACCMCIMLGTLRGRKAFWKKLHLTLGTLHFCTYAGRPWSNQVCCTKLCRKEAISFEGEREHTSSQALRTDQTFPSSGSGQKSWVLDERDHTFGTSCTISLPESSARRWPERLLAPSWRTLGHGAVASNQIRRLIRWRPTIWTVTATTCGWALAQRCMPHLCSAPPSAHLLLRAGPMCHTCVECR